MKPTLSAEESDRTFEAGEDVTLPHLDIDKARRPGRVNVDFPA